MVGGKPQLLVPLAAEWQDECTSEFIPALVSCMRGRGLRCLPAVGASHRGVLVEVPRPLLEVEAEAQELPKFNGERGLMEPFTFESRDQFRGVHGDTFFSYAEEQMLAATFVERLRVPAEGAARLMTHVSAKLRARLEQEIDHLHAGAGPDASSDARGEVRVLAALRAAGALDEPVFLHDRDARDALFRRWMFTLRTPLDDVVAYFGAQSAMYFAWMDHFTRWLLFPGVLGLLLFLHRTFVSQKSVEDSSFAPLFSVVVVLWGVAFDKYWSRRSHVLAHAWGTEGATCTQDERRPTFHGTLRTSPVTGRLETHYPAWQRRVKYCVSALVTLPFLAAGFAVMTCSLNLQGYIRRTDSILHVPALHQFSQPGRAFDPESWLSLVPVVLHATCIMVLNQLVYRSVAQQLTRWENHETFRAHENSLIVKRFMFEFFDAYIALFYLAFYERDIVLLRAELVSLFTTDSARRIMTETVLPMVLRQWHGRGEKKVATADTHPAAAAALQEACAEEHEDFDDFLEMVLEFGYVSLFASAMPLAAAVAIICNVVEVKSDAFRLCLVMRKPRPHRAQGIGAWHAVLRAMIWASVVTNILLCGFASDQFAAWFPSLFSGGTALDDFGTAGQSSAATRRLIKETMALGKGRVVVGMLWAFEHVVILAALAIHFSIPGIPGSVRILQARRLHLDMEDRRAVRQARLARVREQLLGPGVQPAGEEVGIADGTPTAQQPGQALSTHLRTRRRGRGAHGGAL